ncbi:MAG: DUF1080 domain-containing protein [Candidatus Omnitrophica bacterium]|nr:DUF1080 domain-containing protein [Candidatus Omnitrophota bacterium]
MMLKRILCGTLAIGLMAAMALPGVAADGSKKSEEGFKQMFDGKTLDGWEAYTNSGELVPLEKSAWSVKDGEIYCNGEKTDYWIILPGGKYGDMTLRFEFKVTDHSNSGAFFKCPAHDLPAFKGYEVQIQDDHGNAPDLHVTGSIYDVLCPMRNMSKPKGEWNEMEVINKGIRVKVKLNGFKVIDADLGQLTEPIGKFDFPYSELPEKGYIGFQNHGRELWFRNVRMKVAE